MIFNSSSLGPQDPVSPPSTRTVTLSAAASWTFVTQTHQPPPTSATSTAVASTSTPSLSTPSARQQPTIAFGTSADLAVSSAPARSSISLSSMLEETSDAPSSTASLPSDTSSSTSVVPATVSNTQDEDVGGHSRGLSSTVVTPLFAVLGSLLLIVVLTGLVLCIRRRRSRPAERARFSGPDGASSGQSIAHGYEEGGRSEDDSSGYLQAENFMPKEEPLLPNRPATGPPGLPHPAASVDVGPTPSDAPDSEAVPDPEKAAGAETPWLHTPATAEFPVIVHGGRFGENEHEPQDSESGGEHEPDYAIRSRTLPPPPRVTTWQPGATPLPTAESEEPRFVAVLMDLRASAFVDQPPPYQPRPQGIRLESTAEREEGDGL
ncbi:hypothetical protein BV20DRAFT_872262 [Pilatotrama ljubarskyi]|nr:hypothetical protein BV20DRAFT_872262 [Pilatotrama ljubarskyi]